MITEQLQMSADAFQKECDVVFEGAIAKIVDVANTLRVRLHDETRNHIMKKIETDETYNYAGLYVKEISYLGKVLGTVDFVRELSFTTDPEAKEKFLKKLERDYVILAYEFWRDEGGLKCGRSFTGNTTEWVMVTTNSAILHWQGGVLRCTDLNFPLPCDYIKVFNSVLFSASGKNVIKPDELIATLVMIKTELFGRKMLPLFATQLVDQNRLMREQLDAERAQLDREKAEFHKVREEAMACERSSMLQMETGRVKLLRLVEAVMTQKQRLVSDIDEIQGISKDIMTANVKLLIGESGGGSSANESVTVGATENGPTGVC